MTPPLLERTLHRSEGEFERRRIREVHIRIQLAVEAGDDGIWNNIRAMTREMACGGGTKNSYQLGLRPMESGLSTLSRSAESMSMYARI